MGWCLWRLPGEGATLKGDLSAWVLTALGVLTRAMQRQGFRSPGRPAEQGARPGPGTLRGGAPLLHGAWASCLGSRCLFVSAVSPGLEEGGAVLAAVKDEPRSRAVACDDPWPPLRAAPCACCRPGRRNGAQPNRDTAVGGRRVGARMVFPSPVSTLRRGRSHGA